jgi:FKBP-type peptidyl-prolyl cis-trans isomerase
MLKKTIIFSIGVLLLFSCEKKPQLPSNKNVQKDSTSIELMRLNELMIEVEQRDIKSYIDTSSLKFEESPIGFFYAIKQQGKGDVITKNSSIIVDYQIESLHGDTLYSFTGKTSKELKVGIQPKERGFDYALTQLRAGSQAVIIVPFNLAYGVLGDKDQIQPWATLLYRINNIKFK